MRVTFGEPAARTTGRIRSDAFVSYERTRERNVAANNSAVAVGDERKQEFPPLTRTMFVRYAGASGDFNPMHHDDTIAAQVGNPSVFGHGMLSMGLAARVVKDWFGAEAMRVLKVRFAKQVWPGETLSFTARVTGREPAADGGLVDLDLTATNQDGEVKLTGTATATLSE